ncbi:MAG TPA: ABC transporter permease subunit [Pseudolysinimonas sp.]|nr:ABC transporter permease subunit [Pseudolysinimonas sp.]
MFEEFIGDLVALAPGLRNAAQLAATTIALAYPLGLLLGVLLDNRVRLVRIATLVVVELGRGMPLLVILYLVYRGLPEVGVRLDAMPSAIIAFTWSIGAYSADMFRSSIHAIPPGQREAAIASGLNARDTLRFILLPQAARIAIPPLMNLAIITFQLTSLAYAITLPEIMHAAYLRGSVTFRYLDTFVVAAVLYAVVAIPAALLVRRLERRLSRHLA